VLTLFSFAVPSFALFFSCSDTLQPEDEGERAKRLAAEVLMQLQLWASFRAQTLARTVRGLMYHAEVRSPACGY
jgi:hypothetical protein